MLGNPLARTDQLVVQKSGNEHLVYDLQSNKAICLNQTSALVWEHCDGKHSVSDIAKELEKKLVSEVSEDLVLFAINQLANEGLLSAGEELPNRFRGLSRREVIRKVGMASVVALPIVSAIAAPNAAHAQSCLPPGTPVLTRPPTAFQDTNDCFIYCNAQLAYFQCCSLMGGAGAQTMGPPPDPPTCDCLFPSCI